MKRIIIVLIAIMFFIPVKAYATDNYLTEIDEITDEYNVDSTLFLNGNLESIIDYLTDVVKSYYKEPLKITLKIATVLILYSISKTIFEDNMALSAADNVYVLTVFITLLTPIKNIIEFVSQNLETVKNFMTTFIPVYAGIIMASGEFVTSTVFTGFFLTAMVSISNLCLTIIIPSLKLYISLIISDALSPFIRLKTLGEFYLKSVKNTMKLSVSRICFLLTLQSTISAGKDTLAVKTGKFIAGAAIPVIGSSLQDAVSGIYASMESIKGYAGVVGLSAVLMIFLPSFILLVIYWVYTSILYVMADLLDAGRLAKCIKGFTDIVELLLSVLTLYVVMFVFSITIMIAVTNGV